MKTVCCPRSFGSKAFFTHESALPKIDRFISIDLSQILPVVLCAIVFIFYNIRVIRNSLKKTQNTKPQKNPLCLKEITVSYLSNR